MMKLRDPKKQFPNIETPPEVLRKPDDRITETRQYRLITPLFGGGVKAQEADPVTVIRGASVRGQLRFWWRATRGGQFNGDLDEMRKAENAIWGSAAKKGDENTGPSKVQVVVKILRNMQQNDSPFEVVENPKKPGEPKIQPRRGSSAHPYAAFPLQPKQEEAKIGMQTAAVKPAGIEFSLEISYPKEFQKDVTAALWAWETFGGIGARTRRGFGALQHIDADEGLMNTPQNQVIAWIRQKLQTYEVTGNWVNGVPHLSADMLMAIHTGESQTVLKAQPGNKVIAVWQDLIAQLQRFRQAPIGRKEGKPKPGRSYWSEPEQIRALTGKRSNLHTPLPVQVKKFPRGQFGLPIIFHFKDKGEPSDTTLQGAHHDRLGSPLILRPLICKDGAIGLGAKLVSYDPPGGYILKGAPKDPPVEVHFTDADKHQAKLIRPLQNGETDVIEAFLKTLK